ncbi:MAG: FHA domain-containing protein [Anaerolineae bacterium]|nr:FHA domain-containing protein [Anaerolineae bacterium]
MAHFYLYLANILLVLTLLGLFIYLAGRVAYHDGLGLLGQSLHSIGGAVVPKLLALPSAAIVPGARHLIVLETSIETGMQAGHIFTLQSPITKIGRSARNHIVLNDPLVSSEHVAISYEGGVWLIEDQHSRNGTILYPSTGSSLQVKDKPEKFQSRDVLCIGNTRLRLQE